MNLTVVIDESGDLGFKDNSSRIFLIAYVITYEPDVIRKKIKRLLKRINSRNRKRLSEFKFSKDSDKIKDKFFKHIKVLKFDIGYIAVNKEFFVDKKDKPLELYNNLIVNYVIKNISKYEPCKTTLILDKSYNKYVKDIFVKYKDIDIIYENSEREKLIQLADYIAGAAFSKIVHDKDKYYNTIKTKIEFRDSIGNIEW